jgi:NTE family protein
MRTLPALVAIAATLAAAMPAAAQTPTPASTPTSGAPVAPAAASPAEGTRPRICLVLSGGGARGAAHVGVLKVLDELRVPIDCVAGTSMGSIVGGAFATGVTVAEMEKTLGEMSTDLLFKEKPPRRERSIRRKADDFTSLFTPEIGIRDGALLLPKGIISGVQLETVLRTLARAQGFRTFDELPVPFRAIATDLVTGKAVVFSSGELASVMRASMSVPGLIDPVEIEGKLLVDGGLTDNLPVNIARTMGADVVIAVNLGTPLMKREDLTSIFGVTEQMINILTEQNVQASLASLKPTDILILPELGNFSAGDFDSLLKTIPIGEAAARKVADRLSALSLPPAEYAALRQRQLAVAPTDLRPVDEIRFTGLTRVNPAVLEAEMETRPGQPIDQRTLDRDMQRIYGTDDFEHVSYRVIEETGKRVLSVDAIEKSWGPDYLRFGLGLTSDFKGDAYYNLLASYRKTWINSLGAEWRTDLQVGRTNRILTEFYQPLEVRRYFFVAPYAELERRQLAIFDDDQRLAIYDVRYGRVGFDLGSQFTRYGELRLGLLWGNVSASVDTGPTSLEPNPNKADQAAIRGRLFFDQLDNVNFPRSGYGGTVDIFSSQTALGATANYTKWTVDGTLAHSFGDHTFSLGLRLGGRIGSDPIPAYDQFNWGGFLQQSGYRTGALLGQSITFGRLVYFNRLAQFTLVPGIYAGLSLEAGRVGQPFIPGNQTGTLLSAAAFFGLDSPIGPVYLGYGRTDAGFSSFYFYLGRP